MYNENKEQERVYTNPTPVCGDEITPISEFKNLYDHFKNAVNHSKDLSNSLYRYGNSIKTIQEPTETTDKLVEKTPQGLIEMLWQEIFKLQKVNSKLVVLENHLRDTIG